DDDPGPDDREPRLLQVRLGRLRRRRRDRAARHQPRRRPQHLGAQERARVDAEDAPARAQPVREEAHADVGLGPVGHRLRQHQVLRALHGEAGHQLGGPARGHQEHLRQARHPRGGEAAPRRRCGGAVRVGGRLPPDPRGPGGEGRHLRRHRHRAARARGAVPRVLRLGHPGRRQQVRRPQHRGLVRRVVHLRPQGRQGRHPAAGLLPHQHREHGPVRAHADHRRRGLLGALRRGLHGPHLLERLAPLRGRRDHRQEGRPRPLHDDPELVEQRLQ
ncbi:MAG: Iron-sulfur cluster assembly protein SufB, partial [uncultured Gemmatimonadaceae bacterium]